MNDTYSYVPIMIHLNPHVNYYSSTFKNIIEHILNTW